MADYAEHVSIFIRPYSGCYLGTRVKVVDGNLRVEGLTVGDCVVDDLGMPSIVKSIVVRRNCIKINKRDDEPDDVLIRTGAIADGVPERDIRLPALSHIVLNQVEVPVYSLINKKTIVQVPGNIDTNYFFIETNGSGKVVCEGIPLVCLGTKNDMVSECYINEFGVVCPNVSVVRLSSISRYVEYWSLLDASQKRIQERFSRLQEIQVGATVGQIYSLVELIDRSKISGWVWRDDAQSKKISVEIYHNQLKLGEAIANSYCPGIKINDTTNGAYAFTFYFPEFLSQTENHTISAKCAVTGAHLSGSPFVLNAISDSIVHTGSTESHSLLAGEPENHDDTTYIKTEAEGTNRSGRLEKADRQTIVGWAWDSKAPTEPSFLRFYLDDGQLICKVFANKFRRDLEYAGIGDGRHGFEVNLLPVRTIISDQFVHVCFDSDGLELENSPIYVGAPSNFDNGLKELLDVAVNAVEESELEPTVNWLAGQVNNLLHKIGNSNSQRHHRLAYRNFRRRWGQGFHQNTALDKDIRTVVADPGLRAMVVDDEIPSSHRDAGSQAILSHMNALQNLGYSVTFVAAQQLEHDRSDVCHLEAVGISCPRTPYYTSVEEVLRQQQHCLDLVYLHRLSNVSKYLALTRQYCPSAILVYSVADLHHIRIARQAEVEERPELIGESNRLRLAECAAAWQSDVVLTHSHYEADVLRRSVPDAKVSVVPWAYKPEPVKIPFMSRHGLAFVGNFSHEPNVDAAYFLAHEIMPLVWRDHPEIECILAGSGMTARIRGLRFDERIFIMGHVDQLSDVFERARITVAPLRYGAGVKGKVLSSVSAGVPCIMSHVAAEGVAWPPLLMSLIGNSPAELVQNIGLLHADECLADEVASTGLSMIRDNFSQSSVDSALSSAIEKALKR